MRLSLAHINAKAPYVVTEYEEGSVCFITDNGVEYWISFIEETNIGIPYAYQLVIMNQSHTKIKGTDSKIAETVASILFSFFEDERHILFYICDTSDKHEAARHRKFKSWFERFSDPARFAFALFAGRVHALHDLHIVFERAGDLPHSDIFRGLCQIVTALRPALGCHHAAPREDAHDFFEIFSRNAYLLFEFRGGNRRVPRLREDLARLQPVMGFG